VDIGTNSFHLVVAKVLPNGRFQIVTTEKEMVRLGSGSGDMKHLDAGAVNRGVAALRRFRQVADSHGAELRAVGTSAVREAANQHDFLERCRTEAGVEVEVISGTEEARLIHLGVLQALQVYDRQLVLIDIGGGSTEFLVGKGSEVLFARSVKVGAIRLTDRFFPGGVTSPKRIEKCRDYLRSFLAPTAAEVRGLGFEIAVASSGTAETVAMVAAHLADLDAPPRSLNGFTVSRAALDDAVDRIVRASRPETRLRVPGMDERRGDIIAAGALWLQTACHELDLDTLTISSYALREGVLLDQVWGRIDGEGLSHLSELRRSSVDHLLDQFESDIAHARWTTELALQLFDQTRAVHRLPLSAVDYLEAGALLANIGQAVAHSGHHLHSAYLIRNSEHLMGFTAQEIETIAQVARYHRKSSPKLRHREFAALDEAAQRQLRILAGIVRVAIGLDRGHRFAVAGVRARVQANSLVIDVVPGEQGDVALEIYSAQARAELLAEALQLKVEIRPA
jgi:exopolyphosphatase/guanosine-5'-triphosphate,3'-diphosphate pyrophosphatase